MTTAGIAVTAPEADITTLRAFLNQYEGVYRRVIENEAHPFCPGHVVSEVLTSDEARDLFDHEHLDTPVLVVYHAGQTGQACGASGSEVRLRPASPVGLRPDLPRSIHQLIGHKPWEPYGDPTRVFTSLPAMLWFEPVKQG